MILHKNVPKVVNKITNIFAAADINIENLANRSKKDNAYTAIDTTVKPDDSIIAQIRELSDVLHVRAI